MCRYESMCLSQEFAPGSNPPGEPWRYTVDVDTGVVTETRLAGGLDMDFPIIPPHLVAQPAKYMYMSGTEAETRRHGIMCAHALLLQPYWSCVACHACRRTRNGVLRRAAARICGSCTKLVCL